MEDLIIEGQNSFPTIDFKSDGYLILKGRPFFSVSGEIYEPVITFITNLKVEKVFLLINFDLLNPSTAKHIYLILKEIGKNSNISEVYVKWHYEEGDEESSEFGQLIETSFPKYKIEHVEHCLAI